MSYSRRINFPTQVLQYCLLLAYVIPYIQPFSISRSSNMKLYDTRSTIVDLERHNELSPVHDLKGNSDNVLGTLKRRARSLTKKTMTNPINTLPAGAKRTVILYCLSEYLLAIKKDGKVMGVKHDTKDDVNFTAISYGNNSFAFKGAKSQRYIAMNHKGKVYSTKTYSDEVIFKVINTHKIYQLVASNKYYRQHKYDMLLGIRKNGLPQKGYRTSAKKKFTRFLIHK